MVRYKAVLFDADGTLWSSLWHSKTSPSRVWRGILAELGFDVPADKVEVAWERERKLFEPQLLAFESSGQPNEPSAIKGMFAASEKRIVDDLGLTVDLNRLRRLADDMFTGSVDLYPETVEVLAKLRTMGMQMAIVSNGVNQERAARRLGIDRYFDRIIGSAHVGFAKPRPEVFHLALSALGIGPQDAIMVGDSWAADVLGARGVGVRCLHVVRGDEEAVEPDTIQDLRGVVELLTEGR